ncbi:MAG: hypothetical protein AAGA56_14245 [Myxococcota bacterium]
MVSGSLLPCDSILGRLLAAVTLLVATAALAGQGCALSNIDFDSCRDDAECESAFGLGSTCSDGFCSDRFVCETGHDCRAQFGGGFCAGGACRRGFVAGPDGTCPFVEPADLAQRSFIEPGTHVPVGVLTRTEDSSDDRILRAVQLAAQDINGSGGLNEGRPLGLIICDTGLSEVAGTERDDRIRAQVDYLAGTVGASLIIGPTTSSDSLVAVAHLVASRYPTTLISPAATSPALTTASDRLDRSDPIGLFWRTAPSDSLQGRLLAQQVVGAIPSETPVSSVSVVYLDDAYGEGLSQVFAAEWGNTGPVELFPYDPNDVDYDELAGRVADRGPDAVVIIALDAGNSVEFLDASLQFPALDEVPYYLTDGSKDGTTLLASEVPAAVRELLYTRVFGTGPGQASGSSFDAFAAGYQDEHGVDPRGFAWVANAYDATFVGAAAIVVSSAGGRFDYDGRQVAEAMTRFGGGSAPISVGGANWTALKSAVTQSEDVVDLAGVSGDLDFDPTTGDVIAAPIEVWRPSSDAATCGPAESCFETVLVIE